MRTKVFLSIILFFAVSIVNGQTDIKDLEKKAKKGDVVAQRLTGIGYLEGYKVDNKKAFKWLSLAAEGGDAEAMYRLGNMYEDGKVKDGNSEMAWSWYVKAANVGNVESQMLLANSLKEQNKITEAKDWYFRAAFQENADAQYEYAMILLSESNESEAKSWFKKAADKNHILAKIKYDAIVLHEREVAEAEARRLALEAARRDSIQRVQAEQQRRKDSIDYATGVRLRPYSWLVSDCDRATDGWKKRLFGLTRNNMFIYKGKSDPDGLDLAIYNKSEEAQEDKRFLSEHKKDKFAFRLPMYYMEFAADGFSFQASSTAPFDDKAMKDYLKLDVYSTILFPIKPICVKKQDKYNWKYTFKCNDINKLQRIKSAKSDVMLLLIFNAGLYHPKNKRYEYVGDDVYITKPVGIYVVNEKTDEVLLDLSNNIRIPTTAEFQKFDNSARLEYTAKKNKKDDSPSMPMVRRTCTSCGGTGIHVWPSGHRDRCMGCDGKGYTLSYF